MPDELETILRLVAEGKLSADEAGPIIEALTRPRSGSEAPEAREAAPRGRQLRIRVTERGRQVVNLRIPLAFADKAMRMVPGIGEEQAQRISAAVGSGTIGPIIDVEDESGDAVLISLE